MRTHTWALIAASLGGCLFSGPPAIAQLTEIASVSSVGQQGNDVSGRFAGPALSADGVIVAFDSRASTLVPGDTNLTTDVFVHDSKTGATERVSLSSSGDEGNDVSTRPGIDAAGNLVVFDSAANNLVPGDANIALDVFVHHRDTHTTELASVSSGAIQGDGASYSPTISANGQFVCFVSAATNLVADDTNNVEDVFVRDLIAGTTERVSMGDLGQQSNSSSTVASISADGRWVVFSSYASNLVPGDLNEQFDVFIHDRTTGLTELVSAASAGQQADGISSMPAVSEEGRYVVYWSDATNLVPGDTNERRDIFLRDRTAGTTERVSVSSAGAQADGDSQDPAVRGYTASGPQITPNGRWIAFYASATNLVPGDTNTCPAVYANPGQCPDVFVRDRVAGTTTRVNVANDGVQANDRTTDPAISASGRVVAYFSAAGNLVDGDTNICVPVFPINCPDIFTSLVDDIFPDGFEGNGS